MPRLSGPRRESEATHRRRVQLARERQGPSGRWESNKKKAEARAARRGSRRLGPLVQGLRARQAAAQTRALREAGRLAEELLAAADATAMLGVIADLDRLPVTAKVLHQTLLPKKLREAARRFGAAREPAQRLFLRWRDAFREEVARLRADAAAPSRAVARAQDAAAAAAAGRARSPAPAAGARQRSASASSSSSDSSASPSVAELPAAAAPPPTPAGRPARPPATPQRPRRPPKQQRITSFLKPAGA